MKGSIRFNNAVNAEVTTDGTAITKVVNLADGSEYGGANNYVETITGTAGSIFADMGYDDAIALALDISYLEKKINASVLFDIDASQVIGSHVLGQVLSPNITGNNIAVFKICDIGTNLDTGAFVECRVPQGGPSQFKAYQYVSGNWVDVSNVFETLPITLTIYHHPMPE